MNKTGSMPEVTIRSYAQSRTLETHEPNGNSENEDIRKLRVDAIHLWVWREKSARAIQLKKS